MLNEVSPLRRRLVAGALAALVAGCAGSRTSQSTGEAIDDAAITTKVKAALVRDPVVSALAINVETYKGTVQLSGFARNEEERTRAVELARGVDGVKAVRNDIALR